MSEPFRLALREEGAFWNAYVAKPNTMEGALLIGCIAIGAVTKNETIRREFMALMKNVIAEGLSTLNIPIDHWLEPQTAPESERGGHS